MAFCHASQIFAPGSSPGHCRSCQPQFRPDAAALICSRLIAPAGACVTLTARGDSGGFGCGGGVVCGSGGEEWFAGVRAGCGHRIGKDHCSGAGRGKENPQRFM